MTFFTGWGFAELSEKVIMALSLELSGILWWNFAPIDIDKMHPMRLSNDIWDWLSFLPRFKFWKKWDYCKMTFIFGSGFAERLILKKWKWPYLLNLVEYIERLLRKHWHYQDLAQEIVKCHFHQSRFCRAPNSEKVKMALSLELSGILWWNFKEFMRGCIKRLFKIQYECVKLSSIVRDFSPIIYYCSQLSFTTMSFPKCMLPIWQEFLFFKMSHDIWTYYVFE